MLYKYRLPIIIAFLVLIADQVLKFWIKLNFYHGESLPIFGEAFTLHFVENEGMAFGWKLAGEYGKIILTVFRIAAVFFIAYYLYILTNKKAATGLIVSISLIMAGAFGNIIDSVFYGVIFSASPHNTAEIAQLFPAGGGYGTLLHGKVVDMLSFRLFELNIPYAIPVIGGKGFTFFGPIFNIADAAITGGVIMILLFQKRYFKEEVVVETSPIREVVPEPVLESSAQAPVSSRLTEESEPYDSQPTQPSEGDETSPERANA
ncbi:lipoprotein signal peptidase [soil metagenome]